jgi:hypothetical protein
MERAMDFFDPRDWWPLDREQAATGIGAAAPRASTGCSPPGWSRSACLFLGSLHPPGSAFAATASLLIVAAFAGVLEAAWRGEAPLAEPRLTAWDQAAILLALALVLRLCAGAGPPSVPGGPVL